MEVGCGDGAIIGALNNNIKRRVGADLSECAIQFARAFFPNIDFHVTDASTLSEQFDAVLAVEVLEHIPDQNITSFLQTLCNRTKKGGLIYISVPSVNLPLYSKHYRHYNSELLEQEILEAGLDAEIKELRMFRSPVWGEEFYKRLTQNRLWSGEIHFLRRYIWSKIERSLDNADYHTAQHVIAVLKKK